MRQREMADTSLLAESVPVLELELVWYLLQDLIDLAKKT